MQKVAVSCINDVSTKFTFTHLADKFMKSNIRFNEQLGFGVWVPLTPSSYMADFPTVLRLHSV